MKFAIVTGTSKGLGEAVATLLLELGINVIGISRNSNNELTSLAEQKNVIYEHYSCDLGEVSAIESTIGEIKQQLQNKNIDKLYLINNAATLDPVNQAMNVPNNDLANHFQVNAVAPMILMNSFLRHATEHEIQLIGVTISSGAAEGPMFGWSAYCSSKASINMYTRTVALEQDELQTGNKVIAFSPGIMDTDMQGKIRSSSKEEFKDVETFKGFKKNNHLRDVNIVGSILVDIITDEVSLTNGKIYHVNDYT